MSKRLSVARRQERVRVNAHCPRRRTPINNFAIGGSVALLVRSACCAGRTQGSELAPLGAWSVDPAEAHTGQRDQLPATLAALLTAYQLHTRRFSHIRSRKQIDHDVLHVKQATQILFAVVRITTASAVTPEESTAGPLSVMTYQFSDSRGFTAAEGRHIYTDKTE